MAGVAHEHWVAERRSAGWVSGPERDVAGKITPYLIPYAELPEDVKEWDRQAVRAIPEVLAAAGLEVYRLARLATHLQADSLRTAQRRTSMTGAPSRAPFEWSCDQIEQYRELHPRYQQYAKTLRDVLEQAARQLAPLAIVQTRPKAIASFAEKIQRKWPRDRNDPVNQFTDLCGGRVITFTQPEVKAVCDFILQHFEIDWENSVDVSQRLKPTEFGYRSVHYIVQFKPGVFPTEHVAVTVPAEVYGLKAEIQVRTLLEHAWAGFGHDRVYKSAFAVPAEVAARAGGRGCHAGTGRRGVFPRRAGPPKVCSQLRLVHDRRTDARGVGAAGERPGVRSGQPRAGAPHRQAGHVPGRLAEGRGGLRGAPGEQLSTDLARPGRIPVQAAPR